MRHDAVEIDAEDHEEIVQRVAAIDVAKATAMVCTRVAHASKPGKRLTKVWNMAATTNAIMALAEELAALGIERVVVESTSDYWRSFAYLPQARGLTTWLVNARTSKQLPGRPKTDKLDAVAGQAQRAGGCSGPRSSLRSPSASSGTTPGCGSI